MNDAKQTCQPSIVSAEFTQHMQACGQCQIAIELWKQWEDDSHSKVAPPALCEEGRKILAKIFN